MRITVLGGGTWGTAFAVLAARAGPVTLAIRDSTVAARTERERRNPSHLPQLAIPERIRIVRLDADDALANADVVASAVPSRATAEVATRVASRMPPGAGILCLTKGLDPSTGQVLSRTWREAVGPDVPYCALTGPNHAEEIAEGQPAATVIAGDRGLATALQSRLASPSFRPYVNDDLVGVELCGAAKNVIAVAAGMGEGIGLGDNARAALVTRGLAEMTRLGLACGAHPDTFRGLAGVGDLVATCVGRYSRNRRAGEMIALGVSVEDVERELGQVAEGIWTTRSLVAMADGLGVELPICREVLAALEGKEARACVHDLMTREPGHEH